MKIILTEDVPDLGRAGDVEEVADGYARNYLIPKGMAAKVTPGALKEFESRRAAQARRQRRLVKGAEALAQRLVAHTLTFEAKAGETGTLYGSVTAAQVAEALEREVGEEFDRRNISLHEPIREVGEYFVGVRLTSEVEPQVKVVVKPEGGELPEAAGPEGVPTGLGDKAETA